MENGLTFQDALDHLGKGGREAYIRMTANGMRRGQAWMNLLGLGDYARLTGTLADPFYKDDRESVVRAFEFLLSK